MRVLAGSGPAGLAGMAAVSGCLIRPLLPFSRGQLARYVQERSLPVWLDPANDDARHQRAWIRRELLPMVRKRIPDVDTALTRSALQAGRGRAGWDALLDVFPGLDLRTEEGGISVAGVGTRGYDSTLVESLILALARRVGCPLGPVRAARVMALLERGESGTEISLSSGWKAELSFGRLRLMRQASESTLPAEWEIEGEQGVGAWGRWKLAWRLDAAPERQGRVGMTAWFTPESLTVRSWMAGEKVSTAGGHGTSSRRAVFPGRPRARSRRSGWPVVAGGDEVVWIPGVCRSDALVPESGTEALRVEAELA